MAYLGRSPSQGVRNRYYKTASGGETSISGALTGGTLTFTDGNYVDVNLNGVTLVAGTDYNTSTANTIAGLSALTASDVVEIVVYDVFSVFSGNVNSDFSIGGNLSVTGTVDIDGGAIDGTAIGASSASTGAFTTVSASSTASIVGHASIGVNAVASTRALTVAGATDGSSSTILQLYNSSLASKFSVRDDGFVDINGAVDMASTLQVDGAITSSSSATITTSDNSQNLILVSTDADANVGPELHLRRNSSSPANADLVGEISFNANNDAGEDTNIASIDCQLNNVADGSEEGGLLFRTKVAGTMRSRMTMYGTNTKFNDDSQDIDFTVESNGNANMLFVDAGNDRVGVGLNSPSQSLDVSGAAQISFVSGVNTYQYFQSTSNFVGRDTSGDFNVGVAGSQSIKFSIGGSEKVRLDSNGNLLVGKTASNIATEGIELRANDDVMITQSGDVCLYLNRLSSDGDIIDLRKDGTTFGSIGVVNNNNPYISNDADNSGLQLATNSILPHYDSLQRDNAVDFGSTNVRWKRGYFSSTVFAAGIGGITDQDTYINFANNNIMQFVIGGSERARFEPSGHLQIGQTSSTTPGSGGNSTAGSTLRSVGDAYFSRDGDIALYLSRNGSDGKIASFARGGGEVGSISVTSSSTSYATSSDRRLKSNIDDAASASDKIDAIQVRQFDWNVDNSHQDYGLIAQELVAIEPMAVSGDENSDEMMGVDYSKLVPMLIKAVQELKTELDAAKTRIATLEAK